VVQPVVQPGSMRADLHAENERSNRHCHLWRLQASGRAEFDTTVRNTLAIQWGRFRQDHIGRQLHAPRSV